MNVYDEVRAYHERVGDDFSDDRGARWSRYLAVTRLFPRDYDTLLDVGCGSGVFRQWTSGTAHYTGIDLLTGTNVLDYHEQHDIVVALGILYRVPIEEQERLIRHMWSLARKALVVQTLTFPREKQVGERPMSAAHAVAIGSDLTSRIALRTDYRPGDLTLALYR